MRELPSGTVTFVFTDIEGSTRLLKQLGDGYGAVLDEHRRIVREAFAAADGVEIDKQGDAFFFAFPRAREAVGAAVEVQRAHVSNEWPEGAVVRIRMGVHTGEPCVGEEGYLGLDVVRAARLCTAARGGRILLSASTRALVGSRLPDGVSIAALGERQLKDLDEPESVYELAIKGVETETVGELTPAVSAESAPLLSQEELNRRLDELGARHAARIEEKVLRSLERDFDGLSREDADVDGLAERASLEDWIVGRVGAAMRAWRQPGGA